jgi:hypothetical protein
MYGLTQLEAAGFKFTPLELSVFNNPSFQYLYNMGWPLKWGEITTGVTTEEGSTYSVKFKPTEKERLTPHGAGSFFDEVSVHFRSVVILAAKVAREATSSEGDQDLVNDLSFWLDKESGYSSHIPFRWVRFEKEHQKQVEREARKAQIAILSQGEANVVVLLVDKLVQDQRLEVRKAIESGCIKRGIFREGREHSVSQIYHMPWPHCISCNGPGNRSGGGHCDSFSSVILIDAGDVKTIMRDVPHDLQRVVKPVRFKVPKSTFSDRFEICVGDGFFPQLVVFSLHKLSASDQERFKKEVEEDLQKGQRAVFDRPYLNSQIIVPDGHQKLNALLLAGRIASSSFWDNVLRYNQFWNKLKEEGSVSVGLVS